jgi:gliding motility-associated-like protein
MALYEYASVQRIMKRTLFILLLLLSLSTKATHIVGGELYYEYVSPDPFNPGNALYNIHLKMYRDCGSTTPFRTTVYFTIINNSNNSVFNTLTNVTQDGPIQTVSLTNVSPCISNPPAVCYEYVVYTRNNVSLPVVAGGYTVSFQDCCRVDGITNITYTPPIPLGFCYTAIIPGLMTGVNNAQVNSNPHFLNNDATLICAGNYFEYDFSATDADGDQLVYSFCNTYNGAAVASAIPPFGNLNYNAGFSASQPMGASVTINANTGKISGIAPAAGTYAITVCCDEYRNGVKLGTARKDFQIKVSGACTVTTAATVGNSALGDGALVNCKDLTVKFSNVSTGPSDISFSWNFGDNTTLADTSHLFEPSYTYPSPGTYIATLIVKNSGGCADTTTQVVRVYPVLTVGAKYAGSCLAAPFTFTDTSATTSSGNIIYRKWDFGEPTLTTDTISNVNPATYTYPAIGTKNASLIVINSVGCTDTARFNVIVTDKPLINPSPRDTLICNLDTVTIYTNTGIPGTYTWSPNYMISSLTSANPRVSPDTDQWYYVTFNNGAGCSNSDSVHVRVKTKADLDIINKDSSFCRGDSVQINASFTGTSFSWSPTSGLNATNTPTPKASPAVITKYILTATLGNCPLAKDSITLTPVNVPRAAILNHVMLDTSVCRNATIELIAGGGSVYSWSPSALVTPNNNDTVSITVSSSNTFTVTVSDTLGCNKTTQATYIVNVSQGIIAHVGNDTIVTPNTIITLHGSGGDQYTWLPSYNLSNANIPNPQASITNEDSIIYHLIVRDNAGCTDDDSVVIRVFKGQPGILVPSVFSPVATDSRNRTLKPLCFGIQQLNYFRIYDRFGKQIFETNICNSGWNGTVNGKPSPVGTYVYVADGIDIRGTRIFKKGYFVLLR